MKLRETKYQYLQLQKTLKNKNLKEFNDKLNIVFVRENYDFTNRFDDKMYLWSNRVPFTEFTVTTKAGKYWWEHFENSKGVAGLVEGQYIDAYALGLHRGAYEALIQVGAVSVYRDKNRDLKLDTNVVDKGLFGINYHTMNVKTVINSSIIDNGSAGCQVNPSTKEYFESMALIKIHQQPKYSITLLLKDWIV